MVETTMDETFCGRDNTLVLFVPSDLNQVKFAEAISIGI
jgi:hypothetical protein